MFTIVKGPTGPEKAYHFLRENTPQRICDDCVGKHTEMAREVANPLTAALGLTSDFDKQRGTCHLCKGEKLVMRSLRYA
jgi:hypothetical protein